MGVVIRQSIKGTVWNYLGVILGAANIMWFFPYYLSPEEIGIYRVVVDLGALFALFAGLGSGHIADRFYVRVEEDKRSGFTVYLFFLALIGFAFFTVLYLFFNEFFFQLFARNAQAIGTYKGYVLALTFTFVLLNLYDSLYRVKFNIVSTVFFREVFLRIIVLGTTVAVGWQLMSFDGMMEGVMWSYWFTVIALGVWYCVRFQLKNTFQRYKPDRVLFRQILSYGMMVLIAGGSAILIARIDVLMIAMMMDKGLDQVAIYSLGFFIASVIEIPRRSISQIATPLIANAWHTNDVAYIDDIYKRSAINQLIIGGAIFMLIWISIDDLLLMIPQHHLYAACKDVVFWIGLSRLVNMIVGLNGEIILQSKYYMFNIVSLLFLVVLITVFNYLFIPMMGIEGAAIGSLLAIVCYNVLKTTFLQLKLNMMPFSMHMVYVILVGLIMYLPFVFWPLASGGWFYALINIGLKSFVYLTVSFFVLYKLGVSLEMNRLLDKSFAIFWALLGRKNR